MNTKEELIILTEHELDLIWNALLSYKQKGLYAPVRREYEVLMNYIAEAEQVTIQRKE